MKATGVGSVTAGKEGWVVKAMGVGSETAGKEGWEVTEMGEVWVTAVRAVMVRDRERGRERGEARGVERKAMKEVRARARAVKGRTGVRAENLGMPVPSWSLF